MSIMHLTSGDDTFTTYGDIFYSLVIDFGGDDTYRFYDDDGFYPDIQEALDGGIDSVYLTSRILSYTLPENVENLYATGGGGFDKGLFKYFSGNGSDNRLDFHSGGGGTQANHIVRTFEGDDWVRLGAGEDWADLGDGDDEANGGRHDDIIFGGAGEDLIYGGSHNDHLMGDDDRDTIYGGSGNDIIEGGQGFDELYGGEDNDTIDGGWGNDLIEGESGNDILYGGGRYDRIYGGAGKDRIEGGGGDDKLFGGANADTYVFRDGDFGRDVVRGYAPSYEDTFLFSTEYWAEGAPDIEDFMLDHVILANGGKNAQIDLQDVGGGVILIVGVNDVAFDLNALEEDIVFL